MAQQEFCRSCQQKDDCREMYRRLGDAKGPSVVAKVVLAFLLPLVVFIVSLAVFERILTAAISKGPALTAASLLLAVAAAYACILTARAIGRWLS